jgi:hypothetical protein
MESDIKEHYENRLVLFVDFLGFKDLVERTRDDPKLIQRIVSAMDNFREIADTQEFYRTQRVTQFSDCVVVSYVIDEESAVFDLILHIGLVVLELAERGFLLRGAVTVGPLLHTKDHLLGPAMVRAYELESRVAKYPRVIVDPTVLNLANARPASHHTGEEELAYVKGFLRKDIDGQLFVDYVSWHSVVEVIGGEHDLYPNYLSRLGKLVRDGLRNQDSGVQEKYLWLYRQYIEAIKVFEETPEGHAGRRENRELFEDILSLPRYEEEAAAAERMVKQKASA